MYDLNSLVLVSLLYSNIFINILTRYGLNSLALVAFLSFSIIPEHLIEVWI